MLLDLLLFKLAFHTYEALRNKHQIVKRKEIKESTEAKDWDANTELDLISNLSDESNMTLGGPASVREKKIERFDESLDVKLNRYLMKWIVVIIFLQLQWLFSLMSIALPAIPLVKLCLAFWIMLPQCRGEFFLYHFIEEYIRFVEVFLLEKRSQVFSFLVGFFVKLQGGSLKFCITYISEDCILNTKESCKASLKIVEEEIECRCLNDGVPIQRPREVVNDFFDSAFNPDHARSDPRFQKRDTFIQNTQSNSRLYSKNTSTQQRPAETIQQYPRGEIGGIDLGSNELDSMNQSMYEMPSKSLDAGKQNEIEKQEEYMKYLVNKQKIMEMEKQLNSTYSHPTTGPIEMVNDTSSNKQYATAKQSTTKAGIQTIGTKHGSSLGVKKEAGMKPKVEASRAANRMLTGQPTRK